MSRVQPHHAVEDDHHHRKERVPNQRGIVGSVQHDRGNTDHLDGRNGERQNQRAIRFAQPNRQMVRMPDHSQDRPQHGSEEPCEYERQPDWIGQMSHDRVSKSQKGKTARHADDEKPFLPDNGRKAAGPPGTNELVHSAFGVTSTRSL